MIIELRCLELPPSVSSMTSSSDNSLTTNKFSPIMFLDHTSTIKLPRLTIWQEQLSASRERSYVTATQPFCPPTISSLPTDAKQKTGVSIMTFNADGTFVATRNDSMSTTVWIWSLKLLAPYAIIVQHSAVRSIQWHLTCSDLLMIHCVNDDRIVYLWSADWEQPRIIAMPIQKLAGKQEARWIYTKPNHRPRILFGDAQNYVIGSVPREGTETESPIRKFVTVGNPEPLFDEGDSFDLSPARFLQEGSSGDDGLSGRSSGLSGEVDDTFHYRRHVANSG